MEKETQNRKQRWSMPQITEIEVKSTEKQHNPAPPGNHHGKNSYGHDAFALGHDECS